MNLSTIQLFFGKQYLLKKEYQAAKAIAIASGYCDRFLTVETRFSQRDALFPKWGAWLVVVLTGSLTTSSLRAQTIDLTQNPHAASLHLSQLPLEKIIPPSTSPTLPEIPPQSLPFLEELVPSPPSPASPPSAIPGTAATIIVTEFKFTGNTAFTSAELAAITAGLSKKPLPLSRLLQIASDVAQIYAERGYSTSGAIISIP